MKLIRCRNGLLGIKNGRCGHIIAILTDYQIAALRSDPEGGPVFRCHDCPQNQRWFKVVDNGNGPEVIALDKPPEHAEELQYTEEKTFNQVG